MLFFFLMTAVPSQPTRGDCGVVDGWVSASTWDPGDKRPERVVVETERIRGDDVDTEWITVGIFPVSAGCKFSDGGRPCQAKNVQFAAPGPWIANTHRKVRVTLDCTCRHVVRVDFK